MSDYNILLVDDQQMILDSMAENLEDDGYAVSSASTGRAAFSAVENGTFDVVITDLVIDDIDGLDVLKKVKMENPETRVMILTGYGDMESAVEALRNHADDYIQKPCSPEEIRFRIQRCLYELELIRKLRMYKKILPVCCECKKIRDDDGRHPGTGKCMSFE